MSFAVRPRIFAVSLVSLAVALSGCKVFDESLIDDEPEGMEPPPGGGELSVSDLLACDAPRNESLNEYRQVDTSRFENDLSTLPNCLGETPAPGNDSFFAVDMLEGQKWHFHAKVASEAIDPAIYVLDSCSDSRSCQNTYFGINACGPGENEHFSFMAPISGRYYVGIDSLLGGGEPIDVYAVHAECGNLVKEHSEFCDDGNTDPLDGCYRCRPVVLLDRAEIEPNDGPHDANLVRFVEGSGRRKITGTLGSHCDFDFFELEVPPSMLASVSLGGDVDCGRIHLETREPFAPNPVAVPEAGSPCTLADATPLPAGTYLARVAARREPGLGVFGLDYTLEIDIRPADAED
jgi:cysteine-rich repeat protein